MPDLQWNFEKWNDKFNWEEEKPGWCNETPENEADWRANLLPRIQSFVPAKRILEIAPGHGRWTHYLEQLCEELLIVDLAPNCIEACKKRFASSKHISYFVNDGMRLDFLKDNSLDFVFSFDSLVHVDIEVIDSYLSYLGRALSADGVGFFHHSNGAALPQYQTPESNRIRGGRSTSVSAEIFEKTCQTYNLRTIVQEIHNWNSAELIDCMSIFCRAGSRWDRPNKVFTTPNFPEQRKVNRKLMLNYVLE